MKIHFLTNDTSFTGGRLILFGHANALAERGHEVSVRVPGGGSVDWMDLSVPVFDLDATGYSGLPVADACIFERRRYARPLCKTWRGVPVHFCQGFEGVDVEVRLERIGVGPAGWLRVGERWSLERRRRAIDRDYALPTVKIVVQEHLREQLVRRYRQTVYLVPNGLPAGIFTPGEDGIRDQNTVLVVGPTDLRCKRIGDALRAVRLVKRSRPNIQLLRVSQHPMSDNERQLGVTDEYHVLLPHEDLAHLYRRATVLLFPSDETEGFGLPMLEAMACGTPVITSDIPAARAFNARGDHARFVRVGRPKSLAKALAALLDDPAEQERLRRRGLEVAARYTREKSHDAMEETLTEIVTARLSAAG
jgi:glycosyltransferase involved in cell wall biosynthesis